MKYIHSGDDFEARIRGASDETLHFNITLHLDHIESQPDNSLWSRPAAAIIQAELDRRNPVTPAEPIQDFIWQHRDSLGRE